MLAYSLPVDIANRALQHCRMARITSLFPPDSNMNAQEIAFCYDKVRTAKLERELLDLLDSRGYPAADRYHDPAMDAYHI